MSTRVRAPADDPLHLGAGIEHGTVDGDDDLSRLEPRLVGRRGRCEARCNLTDEQIRQILKEAEGRRSANAPRRLSRHPDQPRLSGEASPSAPLSTSAAALRGRVDETIGAFRVIGMLPVAQGLTIHSPNPRRSPAALPVQNRSQGQKPTRLIGILRRARTLAQIRPQPPLHRYRCPHDRPRNNCHGGRIMPPLARETLAIESQNF
jgi:hypothetical protein